MFGGFTDEEWKFDGNKIVVEDSDSFLYTFRNGLLEKFKPIDNSMKLNHSRKTVIFGMKGFGINVGAPEAHASANLEGY